MVWTSGKSEGNLAPSCRVQLRGKDHQQDSGWMIVKEWTGHSSNEMWRQPDDCVAWRRRGSRGAPNGLNSLGFKIVVLSAIKNWLSFKCVQFSFN